MPQPTPHMIEQRSAQRVREWKIPTPEEFIAAWGPKLVTTIRSYGIINPSDCEDTYQHLMMQWFAKDYLSIYDPSRVEFSTFFYGFVHRRLGGIRRNLAVRYTRNEQVDTLDWAGIGTKNEEAPNVDLEELYGKLAEWPVRGKRDMARLFSDLRAQVEMHGSKNQSALAQAYGVSPAAVSIQMSDLRDVLIHLGYVVRDSSNNWQWRDGIDALPQ